MHMQVTAVYRGNYNLKHARMHHRTPELAGFVNKVSSHHKHKMHPNHIIQHFTFIPLIMQCNCISSKLKYDDNSTE